MCFFSENGEKGPKQRPVSAKSTSPQTMPHLCTPPPPPTPTRRLVPTEESVRGKAVCMEPWVKGTKFPMVL